MIRRTSDKIQITVSIATLIGLMSLLYTVTKDYFKEVNDRITRFEQEVKRVVEKQNEEIEKLRDRRRP